MSNFRYALIVLSIFILGLFPAHATDSAFEEALNILRREKGIGDRSDDYLQNAVQRALITPLEEGQGTDMVYFSQCFLPCRELDKKNSYSALEFFSLASKRAMETFSTLMEKHFSTKLTEIIFPSARLNDYECCLLTHRAICLIKEFNCAIEARKDKSRLKEKLTFTCGFGGLVKDAQVFRELVGYYKEIHEEDLKNPENFTTAHGTYLRSIKDPSNSQRSLLDALIPPKNPTPPANQAHATEVQETPRGKNYQKNQKKNQRKKKKSEAPLTDIEAIYKMAKIQEEIHSKEAVLHDLQSYADLLELLESQGIIIDHESFVGGYAVDEDGAIHSLQESPDLSAVSKIIGLTVPHDEDEEADQIIPIPSTKNHEETQDKLDTPTPKPVKPKTSPRAPLGTPEAWAQKVNKPKPAPKNKKRKKGKSTPAAPTVPPLVTVTDLSKTNDVTPLFEMSTAAEPHEVPQPSKKKEEAPSAPQTSGNTFDALSKGDQKSHDLDGAKPSTKKQKFVKQSKVPELSQDENAHGASQETGVVKETLEPIAETPKQPDGSPQTVPAESPVKESLQPIKHENEGKIPARRGRAWETQTKPKKEWNVKVVSKEGSQRQRKAQRKKKPQDGVQGEGKLEVKNNAAQTTVRKILQNPQRLATTATGDEDKKDTPQPRQKPKSQEFYSRTQGIQKPSSLRNDQSFDPTPVPSEGVSQNASKKRQTPAKTPQRKSGKRENSLLKQATQKAQEKANQNAAVDIPPAPMPKSKATPAAVSEETPDVATDTSTAPTPQPEPTPVDVLYTQLSPEDTYLNASRLDNTHVYDSYAPQPDPLAELFNTQEALAETEEIVFHLENALEESYRNLNHEKAKCKQFIEEKRKLIKRIEELEAKLSAQVPVASPMVHRAEEPEAFAITTKHLMANMTLLEEQKRALQAQIMDSNKTLAQLLSSNNTLRNEKSQLSQELENSTQSKEEVTNLHQEIATLKEQLQAQADTQEQAHQGALAEKDAEIEELQRIMTSRAKTHQKVLSERDDQIAVLKQQLEAQAKAQEAEKKALDDKDAEIAALKQQLEEQAKAQEAAKQRRQALLSRVKKS